MRTKRGEPGTENQTRKEQRVDYVLAGNYQPVGKIRITAQLFNVTIKTLEQTDQFNIDSSSPLAMQDAIGETC